MDQSLDIDNAGSMECEESSPSNLVDVGNSSDTEAPGSPKDTNELDKAEVKEDEQKSSDTEAPGSPKDTNELDKAEVKEDEQKSSDTEALGSPKDTNELDKAEVKEGEQKYSETSEENKLDSQLVNDLKEDVVNVEKEIHIESLNEIKSLDISQKNDETKNENGDAEVSNPEEEEPVFDGTEVALMESDVEGPAWPERAVALTRLVRQKSIVAMSTVLRRLSGRSDDEQDVTDEDTHDSIGNGDSSPKMESQEVPQKSGWNPLSLIGVSRDVGVENKVLVNAITQPIAMKGRIILYTKLGCEGCKQMRRYLYQKGLRYVEINIDVYPTRKLELEKIAGSSDVPKVFFNEVLIGGWNEIKSLEASGKLKEKIEYVVTETPSYEAPLPPLSGEDDLSSSGAIDELALIVRKMKGSISVKDRFHKMRRFTSCFLGSEAVDFLSEDQFLERKEAVEFGRKLANKLFLHHVADENIFEDGNHLYRFLDDDPLICQCQNIPRGIIEAKPKAITEISSRLRFLIYAILEAYTSEDGKHVDYRNIHGSEEFARYLRIVEELQRVELHEMAREEKLSFFINLYNMMAIHAILVSGHPSRPLERRKFFGDFKYVIGGSTYSLSAIYNGILRGNQRPPYNLIKPFDAKDKRLKVALPYTEPLVHFALVCGTRSGPALSCYSAGDVDKELVEAASSFFRTGGLYVDAVANVVYVSSILKWYSVDFGKNEAEVLKHAANYLEPAASQAFLELIARTHLKVIYQPYDWGLNH